MIELLIVGEGQTEETFVNRVLQPVLANNGVLVTPRLIRTSRTSRGGSLNRDRVLQYLRKTLNQRSTVYVTTFFDLYGLRNDFPGVSGARAVADPLLRAERIEADLEAEVVTVAGCRPEQFFAHIQPYEFEESHRLSGGQLSAAPSPLELGEGRVIGVAWRGVGHEHGGRPQRVATFSRA